jgi:putative transposase
LGVNLVSDVFRDLKATPRLSNRVRDLVRHHDYRKRYSHARQPHLLLNRNLSNSALLVHIKAIHTEVKQEYGWPRMHKELQDRSIRVGKERVRKLMQLHGIQARHKRKWITTTDSKHHLPVAANLLNREFKVSRPNQVWTTDITYIAGGVNGGAKLSHLAR